MEKNIQVPKTFEPKVGMKVHAFGSTMVGEIVRLPADYAKRPKQFRRRSLVSVLWESGSTGRHPVCLLEAEESK